MLGAPPRRVAGLFLCEVLWPALLATLLGLAAGQALLPLMDRALQLEQPVLTGGLVWPAELAILPVLALGPAMLSALLPAWKALRVSGFELLQSR